MLGTYHFGGLCERSWFYSQNLDTFHGSSPSAARPSPHSRLTFDTGPMTMRWQALCTQCSSHAACSQTQMSSPPQWGSCATSQARADPDLHLLSAAPGPRASSALQMGQRIAAMGPPKISSGALLTYKQAAVVPTSWIKLPPLLWLLLTHTFQRWFIPGLVKMFQSSQSMLPSEYIIFLPAPGILKKMYPCGGCLSWSNSYVPRLCTYLKSYRVSAGLGYHHCYYY